LLTALVCIIPAQLRGGELGELRRKGTVSMGWLRPGSWAIERNAACNWPSLVAVTEAYALGAL